jgi:hypothetical protein
MTENPDHDVIDDEEHADPNQEDIGTFDPGEDDEEPGALDDEIDDLPDVGEPDPDEEPILDELTEEESSG